MSNNAKNLTQEPPRSPRVRLNGYLLAGRMIDKGRAHLNGTLGEYDFNCTLDNILFKFKRITSAPNRLSALHHAHHVRVRHCQLLPYKASGQFSGTALYFSAFAVRDCRGVASF